MSDEGWIAPAFRHLSVPDASADEKAGPGEERTDPSDVRRRVLEVVADIPSGRAMTYGDIAAIVGTGPRQVGQVMATNEAEIPWWRVMNAAGLLPEHLRERAAAEYRREGTPVRGERVALRQARWSPSEDEGG